MKITVTLKTTKPGHVKGYQVQIVGNFDTTTDAIALCQNEADLRKLETSGLIKIIQAA